MKLTHEASVNTENILQFLDVIFAFSNVNCCLTNTQESILIQCWEGNSYQQIANTLGYDCDYVKKVGSQLWKSLSQVLGKKVNKNNFQAVLRQYAIKHELNSENLTSTKSNIAFLDDKNDSNITENKTKVDWGEASDISVFYGRKSELDKLESWIINDKCRLIALLAMGGMGKTAVSIKLAQQLQFRFDFVVWRTVRDSPLLSELLADIIRFIDNEDSVKLADSTRGRLSQLIKYLKQYRCLIVIDNFETVLQPNSSLNIYRDGYEDYGELITRVGDVLHQSCVVITSREKPEEIAALQGDKLPVRAWQLQGLDEIAGRELLEAKGLNITAENSKQLIESYQGNALAIKIAATAIEDIFAGDVSKFLAQDIRVFNGLKLHLSRHFDRLSDIEKEIMYWLAINREPVSATELEKDIINGLSSSQILETIEYLSRRSLIERTTTGFTQQPVIMEYVTGKLIETVAKEIITEEIILFNTYALIKPQGKDYLKDSQIRVILEPIINKLLIKFGSKQEIEAKLKSILVKLQNSDLKVGYAAGNIINIFHYLESDLTGFDFSHLPIWQADLRNIKLHNCNFAGADLSKSVFAETIGNIWSLAFSPDGQLLATGDTNSEIQIWQIPQYKRLLTLKGHQAPLIWSVAFSPDGKLLASGCSDRSIKLWDILTGNCLKTLQGHESIVVSVAFNPIPPTPLNKGGILASGSKDGTVKFWSVDRGKCIATITEKNASVGSITFSPDGSILAVSYDGGKVILWDIAAHQLLETLPKRDSQEIPLAFNADGTVLAIGYGDGTIKQWNIAQKKWLSTIQGHKTQISELAFASDSNTLVSSSFDGTIKVWNSNTGNCLKSFSEHNSRISAITLNADNRTLVSASEDGTVRLWNIKTGKPIRLLRGYNSRFWSVTFSKDGQTLYSGSEEGALRIWDSATGNLRETISEHQERLKSVTVSPNGEILASASYNYEIILKNSFTRKPITSFKNFSNWCWSLVFSPDNNYVATVGGECNIHLWNIKTGECQLTLEGHQGYTLGAAFNLDGSILASVSADNTVKLWNTKSGECIKTITGHQGLLWDVAANPQDNTFITGSVDRTVKLWDFTTGKCLKTFLGHQQGIMSVAFSDDGHNIASGSDDLTVRIWDIVTGECLQVLSGHQGVIPSIAFSPQKNILASASHDETIKLWDITTGKCLKTLESPKLYEKMNIKAITGLTKVQKITLKDLGAVAK